ncbi:hypothetical protein YC2023_009915 [Brassica napus]|uniref:(rape) hypothetical protein n=1 Tax=Brassica napus TaxID=3708 RepID=A0A816RF99_BRANA|nr:unnamed protein product [Brassica napus]
MAYIYQGFESFHSHSTWSAFTRITLKENHLMAKQQLHFFELRAGPFGSGLSGKLAMSRKVEI